MYYDARKIQVTSRELRVSTDNYPLAIITGVNIRIDRPNRTRPLLCLLSGVLLLILLIGIVLIIIGFYWWFSQKTTYWVWIDTKNGSKTVGQFNNRKEAMTLESALKAAIAQHQMSIKVLQFAQQQGGLLSFPQLVTQFALSPNELKIVLDDLVAKGYGTVNQLESTKNPQYDFRNTFINTSKLQNAAYQYEGDLNIRRIVTITGINAHAIQPVLDCLIEMGEAIPLRDRFGDTVYRFKSFHQEKY